MHLKFVFFVLFYLGVQSSSFSASLEDLTPPAEGVNDLSARAQSLNWSEGITYAVEINRSMEEVWSYMSDSLKAKDWSVYFSHITPKDQTAGAGVGSLRRCFRDPEEKSLHWDEMFIGSEQFHERLIYTYHLVNYWPVFLFSDSRFFVKQSYETLAGDRTRLRFTSIVDPKVSWLGKAAFAVGKHEAVEIFRWNLENIKANIEGLSRPNAYQTYPRNITERIFSTQIQ